MPCSFSVRSTYTCVSLSLHPNYYIDYRYSTVDKSLSEFCKRLAMSQNVQSQSQNVDEELLDFEVQSPVKVKEECSTHGSCDASNLRKVLDGGSGVKVEADAGLVTVEENALDNLEEGEISEEEEVGESGTVDTKGTKREEQATKQIVCRHFKAGSTCFWGQVYVMEISVITIYQ